MGAAAAAAAAVLAAAASPQFSGWALGSTGRCCRRPSAGQALALSRQAEVHPLQYVVLLFCNTAKC